MADFSDGDWIEGAPKWWWKYVVPDPESFWQAVLSSIASVEPDPHPWLQQVTGDVFEGLAMLHASARADEASATRLKSEAIEKIEQATGALQRA